MADEKTDNFVRDYAGFLLFFIPCVAAVIYTNTLLMPRFERILEVQFPDRAVPGILGSIIGVYEFFFFNFYLVVPPLVLALILLEVFSHKWRTILPWVLKSLRFVAVILTMLAILALATSTLAVVPMAITSENAPAEQAGDAN